MLTEEEKKLIKESGVELCRTAELAKGFHENAKWLTQHYRTLVAELEDEVRALKADVEQRGKAIGDLVEQLKGQKDHDSFVRHELKNELAASNEEIDRLASSVRLWGSLFAVSACVAFVLFMLLLKGVCG